ncbi:phage/plasmid primase, P4 family [Streptomyces sp. NBC_01637]|uniref:DNA primase family protein n=1 Tax=unclassified Streptomyces TaxID=2593676 RepID=UPI00386F2FB3|nr:phage/plasmid primase, P4 family [Streptomyces sp. NBC_01653]WTD89870.1 phage/plasmid primase, P4 family [Streptomyces sp. NBC_01637]
MTAAHGDAVPPARPEPVPVVPLFPHITPGYEPPDVEPSAASPHLPAPTHPMAVARALLPAWQAHGTFTLRHWRGAWMRWRGPHWDENATAAMRADLYPRVEHATYTTTDRNGQDKTVDWAPTSAKIANLMEAMAAIVHLPADTEPPAWLAAPDREHEQRTIVACQNGLLDVTTRDLHPLTPMFFNRVSVPFDYEPKAPAPARWLGFLNSIWPDDPEAIQALQEWFGYVLSGRTDLQKMLLIVGPMRSGKGTIARTLTALVGKRNMTGPTMSSLTTNFGLADLVDKSLAIVADARLPRQGTETIVERLLTISGEDAVTVDRKHREPWSGRLPARFMLLSNELPAFRDSSGAIASRLLILTMTISNLGREDTTLDRDLARELPGILNWALDGLDRLTQRGRLVVPTSSAEAVALLAASTSPIRAFLDDWCEVDPEASVPKDDLYEAWRDWCKEEGRDHPGTKPTFSRDLFAAGVGIKESKLRIGGVRTPSYVGVRLDRPTPRPRWSG